MRQRQRARRHGGVTGALLAEPDGHRLCSAERGCNPQPIMELVTHRPLVSVVTPVHNGEPYLRECIESVLAQTYPDWDHTIVDNCSTDRTLEIARDYAAKDPRIRVWNSETFVRVEQSYNNAFRQISPASKYCKVVAADDWLFPECLEKMVGLAEEHPTVAIVGAYGLRGATVRCQGLPYPSASVSGRDMCRGQLLGGPYVFGTPTSLLFRSDIVRSRHAFFNESNFHCDSEACLEVLEHHDFGFVHQVLTFQRVREDSLSMFSQTMQTYLSCFLLEVVKYGPKYLSAEEQKSRIDELLRSYYHFLGEQIYNRRDQEFWNYHKNQLAALGYPLSLPRLTATATSHALEFVNAKSFVKGVLWPLRRRFTMASR
jgi:glycosyltransferase involved in cell wall biosynthesis